jgi:2,3-dihydroxybiphenyl 1,2-dioxygenase
MTTMAGVSQLGYMGLGVRDIDAWQRFATEIIGFQIGERDKDGTLFLRMDDYHHRLAVHPRGNDDVAYIGWEVPDAPTLRAVADQLQKAGTRVVQGSADEAKARRVVDLIKFTEPNGVASEVFYGPLIADEKFVSPRPLSGFKTGSMGLGHFILVADDFDDTMRFYMEVLGFRVSDYITTEIAPGFTAKLGFMHCNPRHHTLAILPIKNPPQRLNHIMLELNSFDDVGATYYLCKDRRVPMVRELGRHTNDHMVSFYMATPSGFAIEYGWGGKMVDDRTWQVQSYTSGSAWGHRGALSH